VREKKKTAVSKKRSEAKQSCKQGRVKKTNWGGHYLSQHCKAKKGEKNSGFNRAAKGSKKDRVHHVCNRSGGGTATTGGNKCQRR